MSDSSEANSSSPETEGTHGGRRPRRRGWRWAVRAGVAVIVLAGAAAGVHAWLTHRARAAFMAEVEAYHRTGEPVSPADLALPSIPDDRNAVPDLRAAVAAAGQPAEEWTTWEGAGFPLPLAPDRRERLHSLLREKVTALDAVDRATAKGLVDWRIPSAATMMDTPQPWLSGFGDLTNLLEVAAVAAHDAGDDALAVRRFRQVLLVSRAAEQCPTMLGHRAATAYAARAARALAAITPDLRVGPDGAAGEAAPADVAGLEAELLDEQGPRDGLVRALAAWRMLQLEMVRLVAGDLPKSDFRPGRLERAAEYVQRPAYWRGGLWLARRTSAATAAARGAVDWPAYREQIPPEPTRDEVAREVPGPLQDLSDNHELGVAHFRGLAERRLAAAALACRLYAVDHGGRLPGRLEDLVPAYLPAVPADPLAASKALAYAPGDRPIVYSVGEDGRDDGGRELPPDAARKGRQGPHDLVVPLARRPRE